MATAVGSYDWGNWSAVKYNSGTDWTAVAVADEATQTSDAVSLDEKAACEISVTAVEDNTGACDGNLYVYVCRDADGTNYELLADLPALACVIDPSQNTTRRKTFSLDAGQVSRFKVLVDNDSGQELSVSVKIRYATQKTETS